MRSSKAVSTPTRRSLFPASNNEPDYSDLVTATKTSSGTTTANFTADVSGTYIVQVVDYLGRTGAFTLRPTKVKDSYTLAHPGALKVGGKATSASIQSAGDTDVFKVALTKGDTYTFTESGLDDATQIGIVPAAGVTDVAHDISRSTVAKGVANANITASASGTYYVDVEDNSGCEHAYTLSATKVADSYTLETPGGLKVGAPHKATMQSAGDTDWFKVSLTRGDTYAFTESGLDFETSVAVFTKAKAVDIAHQSYSEPLPAANATANFTADATGVYYVEVLDIFGRTGGYTLTATKVTDSFTLSHPGSLTV